MSLLFSRKDLPLDDLPNLIVDLESARPAHIVVVHEIDTVSSRCLNAPTAATTR